MTITVTTVANTQSFGAWLSTTNRLVEIVSQNTVTVDTSIGGSLSTGNGYVNGYFGANYLYVANGLSGGNVSSNGVLNIISNVAFKYSTSNLVTLTANSTQSVLNINVTNVNITANTISITGNTSFANAVTFSEAVTFANAVNMTSTSPSIFSSNVTVSGTVSVGNSTVNTTINSTAFGISNSTVSYSILAPTAAQYANSDYYLNANGQWSRVVTGSNTYIQFNDSETLGSSSSLTFNKTSVTLSVGTFTANSTVVNSTAYNIGSNFIANSTGVYTGVVNGSSLTVGTSTIANATGVYTGVVNGSSLTVGTSTIANSTGVYTGVVNGSSLTVGTSVIANTTRLAIGTAVGLQANGGIGTSGQVLTSNGTTVYWNTPVAGSDTQIQFNDAGTLAGDTGLTFNKTTDTLSTNTILVVGTVNAASHTVGTSTIANSTGVYTGVVNGSSLTVGTSTIANATGVYTGVVNGSSLTVGTSTIANATGVYTGVVNGSSLTVGTSVIANATGVFTTGTVNGATISVGTSVIANTTRLAIGTGVGLQANGGIGTSGQVLTSNGTTVYWSTSAAGVAGSDTQIQFNDAGTLAGDTGLTFNKTTDTLSTNTILVTSTINAASHTVGTSTIANSTGVYTGVVNGSSLTVGTSVIANTTRLAIGTGVGLQANGSIGSAGEVLHSNGTSIYWASDDQGVTSVSTGNGLTGGPITTTGTVSILANSGVTANTTGLFVTQGTGTVVNATGVHVNATYIGTLAANSSTYLGSSINFGNASGIYTTGTINAASLTVGTSVTANSTRLALGTAVGLQANGGIGTAGQVLTSNGTTVFWNTPVSGVAGSDTQIQFNDAGNLSGDAGLTYNKTTDTLSTNTILATSTINAASYTVGTSTIANSSGVYTGVVNGSTLSVGTAVTANSTRLAIDSAVGLQANGGIGTAGQVLTSNGTTVYWGSAGSSGTVSSVNTGNGLTGGPISTTGTVSVLANSGITANSTGLFVTQGTGTVVNATGVHVNSNYIGTITANNATYAFGKSENQLYVDGSTYATYLGYFTTTNLGNSSGIFSTGRINAASFSVSTSTIANSTGVYASLINVASNSVTANSTKLVIGTGVGLQANGNVGTTGQVLTSNGTTVYWINSASLAANSATYLGSDINFGNASGIYTTGTINAASHTVGLYTVANSTGFFTNATVKSETLLAGTISGSNVVLTVNSTMFAVRESVRARAFYSSANDTNLFGVGDIRNVGYSGQFYNGIFFIYSDVSMSGGSALTSISVANVANQRALVVSTGSNTTGSHAIAALNTPNGGGQARIALPTTDGGYSFYSDGGTIGPFTASHDALIAKNTVFEMGDIVTDKTVLVKKLSDVITSVELAVNQCNNPIGVLIKKIPASETHVPAAFVNSDGSINQLWDQIKNDYDYVIINSVGEGCINVVGEGGEIFAGDLLVASSTPGKAMKQSDDIIRNKTIAKARENIKLNPGETAQIACIYLCG